MRCDINIKEILEDTPIIAAVKNHKELSSALSSSSKVIFVLYGNILEIESISKKIVEKDKIAIVHIDLIEGPASKEISIRFIKNRTSFHGIVTTKHPLVKISKACGLYTIFRMFIFDSLSLDNAKKHLSNESDAIEILPGVIPKVIKSLSLMSEKPIIVGGLIESKNEVIEALNSGATCVSTTYENIWNI
jgi:glycerol uptake operon antiterminator